MKLLTKEIVRKFPAIHAMELMKPEDTPIVAKFFTPWTYWTWFATECAAVDADGDEHKADWLPGPGDPALSDFLFFGLVVGHEKEFGYFALSELKSVKGPFGLGIERDMHFNGTMADVMKHEGILEPTPGG